MTNLIETGADTVVSGNPGCLLQINLGLRARNLPIQAVHPVELLDRAYQESSKNTEGRGSKP
jgi:glycolate oxidase iron-sulfur subunit